jgi:hypothetical protein
MYQEHGKTYVGVTHNGDGVQGETFEVTSMCLDEYSNDGTSELLHEHPADFQYVYKNHCGQS